jgi:4a-hydroxytetrahydrobiopterin dehydratase|tara:strand:+ start:7004 stop:7300 length:297 start_codon:yes stop_codon:yes gene_type:complete
MSELLSDNHCEKALVGLDGWTYNDVYKNVEKTFSFNNFEAAVTFIQHVASISIELNHYPNLTIGKNGTAKITSNTDEVNGVTEKDIALAESIEILVSG